MTARLVVLASGHGSNLQAIIDACRDEVLPASVVAVVSDRPGAYALERATSAGATAIAFPIEAGEARRRYDARLAGCVATLQPDIVVLAGWMRLLSDDFLRACPAPVINLHPALPGEFPGVRAIERAFAERDATGRTHTGVMVHYVCDEGVDDGPTIATTEVPILADDTLDTLASRIHLAEHQLLISALRSVLQPEG